MLAEPAALPIDAIGDDAGERPTALPRWLAVLDGIAVAVINLCLIGELLLVFANTLARAFLGVSITLGIDETADFALVIIGFVGGAVGYARGWFMAVTVFVERASPFWRNFLEALVAWEVIIVSAVIGGLAIPLAIRNAGETSTLLGISYVWMTVPMTVGSALFIAHAGTSLAGKPWVPVLWSGALAAALVALIALGAEQAWLSQSGLDAVLAGLFIGEIAIGVPVGFVLASVGILYVVMSGAVPPIMIALTAQRGVGGFIFLALPFFILAGFFMDRGGIGARIVDFLSAAIGHVRGGLLQVLITGMYIVSGISGSKAADMAAVGLPMKRQFAKAGVDLHEAAAVLAASAAMGESVPPSIALLVLGAVTSVSTGALFIAGLVPAATIAVCLMLLVYTRAVIGGERPARRAPVGEVLRTGRRAIIPLLMPFGLIGGIVGGIGTPTEVSTFAGVYGFLLGSVAYREIDLRGLWKVVTDSAALSGMIFFTFSGATLFSSALTLEGLPPAIAHLLGHLGPSAFLPAAAVITAALGALLESVVTIAIVGPLLLPVATTVGVHPLHFGVVIIEAFGVGSIIPPVGLALYIACSITGTGVARTTAALFWYFVFLCVGLSLVIFVPWLTLALPRVFHLAN